MKFTIAKAMRRTARQIRVGMSRSGTAALQRAISGAIVSTAVATPSTVAASAPKKPKTAAKRKSVAAKAPRKPVSPAGAPTDRRLSTVLKQLQAAQTVMSGGFRPSGSTSPTPSPAIPKGAQQLERTHVCSAGARDFQLYLPARQPSGPKGLIMMLHGCTQDTGDFATGTNMNAVAQKRGLAVAYPTQTRGHNASSCWNWFTSGNQYRGAGEPAIIASLARKLMREFGLGRDVVFVAGLSAGGAMAAILADTYPDVFSAVGVHSGLPRGAASNVISAMTAMRKGAEPAPTLVHRRSSSERSDRNVRRIIFHGDADRTVHPSNAVEIVSRVVGTRQPATVAKKSVSGRDYVRSDYLSTDGTVDLELWQVIGTGHAWSGGKSGGSFTDSRGPDASAEMVRFFSARTV